MRKSRVLQLQLLWIAFALCLAPAPASAVLCVGDDGHVAIEATRDGRLCVDQEDPSGGDAAGPFATAPQGCRDTALANLSITPNRPSLELPHGLVAPADPIRSARTLPNLHHASRPSNPSLQNAAILRSVVLRI